MLSNMLFLDLVRKINQFIFQFIRSIDFFFFFVSLQCVRISISLLEMQSKSAIT